MTLGHWKKKYWKEREKTRIVRKKKNQETSIYFFNYQK